MIKHTCRSLSRQKNLSPIISLKNNTFIANFKPFIKRFVTVNNTMYTTKTNEKCQQKVVEKNDINVMVFNSIIPFWSIVLRTHKCIFVYFA